MAKNQTRYVDGFVLVVPKKKLAEYKKMAQEASKIWQRYGALAYRECVIEDPKPSMVTLTFPSLTKAKAGEQVWFSYIEYKSRAHRDSVNKKVMSYMHKAYASKKDMPAMPFDMKRMAYGGFQVLVSA